MCDRDIQMHKVENEIIVATYSCNRNKRGRGTPDVCKGWGSWRVLCHFQRPYVVPLEQAFGLPLSVCVAIEHGMHNGIELSWEPPVSVAVLAKPE